jgi:cbb3-type cytochrome c oxidase subunit III
MLVAALLAASAARAQAPDAADVAEGLRLFRQKGNCQACHGWAGDGRKMDSQMPDGANLRETKLERGDLIVAIKCGRPGRGMPAFDKFAYSDGRCYGMKQADLKSRELSLPDPPATLQPREIELLADFLFAKVIGKGPMDRVKCIQYWGSEVEACGEFPK